MVIKEIGSENLSNILKTLLESEHNDTIAHVRSFALSTPEQRLTVVVSRRYLRSLVSLALSLAVTRIVLLSLQLASYLAVCVTASDHQFQKSDEMR